MASRYGVDVFVIGGGPAGLATAITACRKGLTVVVADGSTPPIDKPCGEGLMPETRRALRDLGIEVPETAGFALRGIRFLAAGAATEAEFPEGEGLGVRRTTLHEALMIAAERAGAKLLWKTPVVGIGARGVHLTDRFVASRWIVGADGSGSRVRKWSGLEGVKKESTRFAARRHYRVKPWTKFMEIYWGKARQAYVTPVSRHEVCAAILAETRQETEFEAALEELPELAVRLSGGEVSSRERGAITQMRRLRRVTVGNVALVGDASGSVDSITGEGLRLSFSHAMALASALERGSISRYQEEHRRLARRPTLMARLLLALGRHEPTRRKLFRGFMKSPRLFSRLLALHSQEVAASKWVQAGASLGWILATTLNRNISS